VGVSSKNSFGIEEIDEGGPIVHTKWGAGEVGVAWGSRRRTLEASTAPTPFARGRAGKMKVLLVVP